MLTKVNANCVVPVSSCDDFRLREGFELGAYMCIQINTYWKRTLLSFLNKNRVIN